LVYCCFNGAHKITRFTFERWLSILAQVPQSVLWLMSSIDSVHERLRAHAAQFGISPDRVIFAEKLPNAAHLARYSLADVFLDSAPYGAHTTASDALYMGVPVLTFPGRSFASRVCASLVSAAGLPELVCETAEQFVTKAVALGHDRNKVADYRSQLRANRSSSVLFDMPRLVSVLEDLYDGMWQDFQQGSLPMPQLQNAEVLLDLGATEKYDDLEIQTLSDYHGYWKSKVQLRSQYRAIPHDQRLNALGLSTPG
jgi:predicted O-linked N-acetylglucosamine transferase (SPINDLY family)